MVISQNFLAYHKSIGSELKSSEERVRNLIGSSHWQTDGEHKESILRKVISGFAPEIYRVGTGFVCYSAASCEEVSNSGQIDILITSKSYPTLYKSGELHFVTPDCANAIVEVKTGVSNGNALKSVLKKLSDDIKAIRDHSGNADQGWAGLFIYNERNLKDHQVLKMLQEVTENDPSRVINCVSIGEKFFLRYWPRGHSSSDIEPAPVWHSYALDSLSHAYFVSNLIAHLSPNTDESISEAWFPVEGTKEITRSHYAFLSEQSPTKFD